PRARRVRLRRLGRRRRGRRVGRARGGRPAAREHGRRPPLRGPPLRLRPRRRGGAPGPRQLGLPGAGRRALHGDGLRGRARRAAADRRLHRRDPARMRTRDIDADGIRLHYAEAGEGPAVVLLHGLSATHANWEYTIPEFADRWRVVAPDLPGHGRSAKPDAPYTIDFYAGVVRSLRRELRLPDANVLGNSPGGPIP